MEELMLLDEVSLNTKVLVANFGDGMLPASLKLLRDIQSTGIPAEIYFESQKLAKQLSYADKKDIPFVVLCGEEEAKRGEVTIKMMKTGKQKSIPQDQVVNYFKGTIDV